MRRFSKIKKFIPLLTAAAIIVCPTNFVNAEPPALSEEIFTWVQSTDRGNYYFNHQQIGYLIKEDHTLDLNVLVVPTICIYDEIQIQDVVQKRRWRMLPSAGYGSLIGRADYLKFDLKNGTVQITERDDLDSTFSALEKDTSGEPIALSNFSDQDVTCKFYKAILQWAKEHNEIMIKRSWAKLSEEDSKLAPEDMPINKLILSNNET